MGTAAEPFTHSPFTERPAWGDLKTTSERCATYTSGCSSQTIPSEVSAWRPKQAALGHSLQAA
jgi:hypothetical protein